MNLAFHQLILSNCLLCKGILPWNDFKGSFAWNVTPPKLHISREKGPASKGNESSEPTINCSRDLFVFSRGFATLPDWVPTSDSWNPSIQTTGWPWKPDSQFLNGWMFGDFQPFLNSNDLEPSNWANLSNFVVWAPSWILRYFTVHPAFSILLKGAFLRCFSCAKEKSSCKFYAAGKLGGCYLLEGIKVDANAWQFWRSFCLRIALCLGYWNVYIICFWFIGSV